MSQILMDLSAEPAATQVPSGWKRTLLTPAMWSSKEQIMPLEVMSQSLTVRSSEPEAISLVSGLNSAELTQWLCAFILNMNLRSYNWKHFKDLSSEPDSSSEPSYERATVFTGAEWDLITCEKPSTVLFQMRIVSSADPDTMVLPVGVIATE